MTPDDIHALIALHAAHRDALDDFARVAGDARDPARMSSFLLDYGRFSHPFAGCALRLAAAFHLATELFCETAAARIASFVLAAAEDEFSDRGSMRRITHRDLCHAMMDGVAAVGGIRRGYLSDETLERLSQRVRRGYQPGQSAEDIFRGLGFHAGSELAGSREFEILDRVLRDGHRPIVSALRQRRFEGDFTAYSWIELHVDLEKDHFRAAADAVALAQESYSGSLSLDERWRLIEYGFGDFFDLLREFVAEERSAAP